MTDGGTDPTRAPSRTETPWPAPPPGAWGADAATAAPKRPRRRGDVIATLAVVVLTGAILAVTFLAAGGDARDDAATSKFIEVGEAIDRSDLPSEPSEPSGPASGSGIAVDDTGLGELVPHDEDLADLPDFDPDDLELASDAAETPGSVGSFCLDSTVDGAVDRAGSHQRIWTDGGETIEISARVLDMGTVDTARSAIEARQTEEFAACAPSMVEATTLTAGTGQLVDQASVTKGDQLEETLLVDGSCDMLLTWRQVERYVVSVKIFACSGSANVSLDSGEALVDAATDNITG